MANAVRSEALPFDSGAIVYRVFRRLSSGNGVGPWVQAVPALHQIFEVVFVEARDA